MPNYIQSAAVVMDNATGALLAVVGGRDAEESKLNRAIQSRRQTGSLFKPFIYATFSSRAILRIPAFRMTGLRTGKYAEPPTGPPAIRTERTGA